MRIRVGNSDLWLEERGEGPALVLVHSLSFDGQMWAAQADALGERMRVVRLDMRGHGRSVTDDDGPIGLDDLADDVALVLDKLGIDTAAYAGLSLGGMIGMRLALRHPQRVHALGLFNTSAEPEPDTIRQAYHQGNENMRGAPSDPAMAAMMLSLMFSDAFRREQPAVVDIYRDKLLSKRDPEALYQVAKSVIWRTSILDELSAITVPTLVVTSDEDRAIPAARGEAIHRAITGSRHLHIEGAGHMTSVEKPNRVTQALRELTT